jgi:hypothetical protein
MANLLFRAFGLAGIVLMGAALAIAPVAAVEGRMIPVSMLGIAGIACLVAAWAVRRFTPPAPDPAPPADPGGRDTV